MKNQISILLILLSAFCECGLAQSGKGGGLTGPGFPSL